MTANELNITPTPALPPWRPCQNGRNERKSAEGNGRADEKALDLPARSRSGEGRAEPPGVWIQRLQCYEKTAFRAPRTLTHKLNNAPHSKALESVCLFPSHFQPIATQPLEGEVGTTRNRGEGGGYHPLHSLSLDKFA
jgi:hypothetical protein